MNYGSCLPHLWPECAAAPPVSAVPVSVPARCPFLRVAAHVPRAVLCGLARRPVGRPRGSLQLDPIQQGARHGLYSLFI